MLKKNTIKVNMIDCLSDRLVDYARKFDLACILDSNSSEFDLNCYNQFSEYDLIAGFANISSQSDCVTAYDQLNRLDKKPHNWFMGYLSYDLKNRIENLSSHLPDNMEWPELYLFIPDVLIFQKGKEISYLYNNNLFPSFDLLKELTASDYGPNEVPFINFTPRITKDEYLKTLAQIQKHIYKGDIYEMNFCQEFHSFSKIDPYTSYKSLSKLSPSPFASFLKVNNKYLLSASPERFLKKQGETLISQPIKGTAKRSKDNLEDITIKEELRTNIKERSENIMIVDLVRNDLSRIACRGSVNVDELCGVYTFPQVHQKISTISAKCKPISFQDIIKATFPMGSMTGAPKVEAMKIIEKYESTKRGIYSGSVGYITPSGNFDLNVVIRSLQYNADNHYLSYLAGSAITALSDPEKEYEECILKTYAMEKAFEQSAYA